MSTATASADSEKPASPRMPLLVGEPDSESFHLKGTLEASELAALIKKPAGDTAARGHAEAETVSTSDDTKLKHG